MLGYSEDIGELIFQLKQKGLGNAAIAEEIAGNFGEYPSSYRRIREWHNRFRIENSLTDVLDHYAVKSNVTPRDNNPLQYPDIQFTFEKYIAARLASRQPITIAIRCDEHLPDENELANRMCIEIENITKPDIILHNGDMFDFSTESRYPNSHKSMATDYLTQAWRKFDNYKRLYQFDPIYEFWISGNHDDRLPNSLSSNSATTRNLALRQFKSDLESRNILFGGWDCHHLHYKRDLLIQHEGSTGVNAARNSLLNAGHGFLLSVFAHAHKVQMTAQTSLAGEHVSIISGCIANKIPQYNRKFVQNWQYGMVLVTLLGNDIAPLWENIKFTQVGKKMKCLFGGEVLEIG